MALEKLNFTKDWNDPHDFPTTEFSEAQVRADMQLLHDETKAAFNKLIDDLDASEVPFTPISNVDCSDVQSAIAQVQTNLEQTVFGDLDLPDSSIETQYLADGAVTTDKIYNGSVTTGKLANGAVTSDKIDSGAVTDGKIGDLAVGTSNIKDGAVTEDKIAAAFKNSKADLTSDGIIPASQNRFKVYTFQPPSGSGEVDQIVSSGYSNTIFYVKSSRDVHLIISANSGSLINFKPGTVIPIIRGSSGAVSISGASGVKIYFVGQNVSTENALTIPDRYGMAILFNITTNVWWAMLGS